MKWVAKLLFLALLSYYSMRLCTHLTSGFTIARIHSKHEYNPDWEVKNPPLQEVFNQPFHYLAAGGQCYVFLSKDGKYVLKFFKLHRRRMPQILEILPLPSNLLEKVKIKREKRLRKLIRDFRSYKLAMENFSEETGLLFVHLNKSHDLNKKARIVDKNGIEHSIDLDQVEFILQKRAILAYEHLFELIKKNDLSTAKESLKSICALILNRSKKGIFDEDPRIHRNFGFINNRAVLIDVGRLRPDSRVLDPHFQKQDLHKITKPLKEDLLPVSPQLAEYLEKLIENV